MSDDLMPIGEFSERSGLSARRLRSYAAAGLLVPTAVDPGSGYRYYAPDQLREARLIDELRNAGMPLADITSVVRAQSSEQLDRWEQQIGADAVQRREALHLARDLLAGGEGPNRAREESAMRLRTTARTDVGKVRDSNEDVALCLDRLVAVADGMGGCPGGEVASALAVSILESAFTGGASEELMAGVRAANRAVFERAAASEELEGMGTTLCAVGLTLAGELAVANVGDSRAYLLRDGALRQLTNDHSVAAELVRRGELTDEDAHRHPHRHVLTRAVGVGPAVDVDVILEPASEGDRILLCSDGLSNDVPPDEIGPLIDDEDLDRAADALMARALGNGGRDNVTVVIAEVCA